MIYLVSSTVFLGVIITLVGIILFLDAKVVKKGNCEVIINDDKEKSIKAPTGRTLLSSLVSSGVYLPSACGGSGACGQCKCVVSEGGGDILPTELPHLSRKEKADNVRLSCQVKVREDMKIQVPPEIFSIKKYHATVVSNKNMATFIKELVLQLDPGSDLSFTAGAYMQIDIPEYEVSFSEFDVTDRFSATWEKFNIRGLIAKSDDPVFRAYSLASPPLENERLIFTIRIATPPEDHPEAPPGVGSSYVFSLKPRDRTILSGPYGDFFVKDTDNEICFIGGGAGMAPMRCHILHQLNELQTKRKISFWYGARSRQEMFYDDEFKTLDEKYENFSFHVALSQPLDKDHWSGMTGYIHQSLYEHYLSSHPDPTEIEYYLCGPPQMLEAVIDMLYNLGVEREMIAFDAF
ncbi:MAG: NADH:ubiquinone reductase (Na(+)-transporting) subunit F [Deltaproteobacteria bacterium]|nr:NADH:ubiquinone reductase (Na(+)-transporting) subunit F [Deltaproteobacteria bacterium]